MRRILVADRGPIAVRILETARRLGLHAIALATPADAGAPHAALADEVLPLPDDPEGTAYANPEHILAAAKAGAADAIHPGAGTLAIDADFAAAVHAAGRLFIGPPAEVLRVAANREATKARVKAAGIPVVPGYAGIDQSLPKLERMAQVLGYPLVIRPAAAPLTEGNAGARLVENREDFTQDVLAAKRAAQVAWDDNTVTLEKHVPGARRISVPIFGDSHDNIIHLFDRDTTLEARDHPLLVEAPAAGLPTDLRDTLAIAAITAGMALSWQNAGVVVFLVEPGSASFQFAGIRPFLAAGALATEALVRQDLVAWQLAVAEGGMLPLMQDALEAHGHAVLARLCTENPATGFLPSAGPIATLDVSDGPGIRVFPGNTAGRHVPLAYPSLLAFLVASGRSRSDALDTLADALDNSVIAGPATNRAFLARIATDATYRAGPVDTAFLSDAGPRLLTEPAIPDSVLAAAAAVLLGGDETHRADAGPFGAPFRLNAPPFWAGALYEENGTAHHVQIFPQTSDPQTPDAQTPDAGGRRFRIGVDGAAPLAAHLAPDGRVTVADGATIAPHILAEEGGARVRLKGASWRVATVNPAWRTGSEPPPARGEVLAPMPGTVTELHVTPGTQVRQGDRLLGMRAMRHAHWVVAPANGTIDSVCVTIGEEVAEEQLLLRLTL